MRRLRWLALVGPVASMAMAGTAHGGSATTTIGQLFAPTYVCSAGPYTYLQTGVADGNPYVIPHDGVITSWTFRSGATVVTGLKLKVGHLGTDGYVIDAEATAGAQTARAENTYPASIPVVAGQMIGIGHNGGNCATQTIEAGDQAAFKVADVGPGGALDGGSFDGFRFPVSVELFDNVPPESTITKGPPKRVESDKVKFRFRSDEAASFECRLKGKDLKPRIRQFNGCDSPRKYKNLDEGRFVFKVRARDAAGNVDSTPAKDGFKIVG